MNYAYFRPEDRRLFRAVDLPAAFPNTSWPPDPDDNALSLHGLVRVIPTPIPTTTPGSCVAQGAPALDEEAGIWRQTWIERPMSPEELAAEFDAARRTVIADISADRDALLRLGAPYGGKRVQVDERARADLAGLALAAVLAQTDPAAWSDGYSTGWITMDNTRIPLPTPAEGSALAAAVGAWYAAVIQAARNAKDAALAVVLDPLDPAISRAALDASRTGAAWPPSS